jgi:hypothetical protein
MQFKGLLLQSKISETQKKTKKKSICYSNTSFLNFSVKKAFAALTKMVFNKVPIFNFRNIMFIPLIVLYWYLSVQLKYTVCSSEELICSPRNVFSDPETETLNPTTETHNPESILDIIANQWIERGLFEMGGVRLG